MAAKPGSVSFEATVTATGNNTGIVVPDEMIEQLAAGRRPPVLINLNGYEYRTTVGVMNGKPMISVSAAVRTATGLKGGDAVHVTLTVADSPREVTIPADFAAALAADEQAGAFSGRSPTACSAITSTQSPPPRPPTPASAASTRPSPCSARASSGKKGSDWYWSAGRIRRTRRRTGAVLRSPRRRDGSAA